MQCNDEKWIEIGYVSGAHGLRGEVFVVTFVAPDGWAESWRTLTVKPKEGDVSEKREFAIKSKAPHKNGFRLKLEGIGDRNASEAFTGQTVLVASEQLVAHSGERPYLRELKGFTVRDVESGPLGIVIGFGSNGAQDLIAITGEHGSFEMPFVEALIAEMSFERRELVVRIPAGLIEINRAL